MKRKRSTTKLAIESKRTTKLHCSKHHLPLWHENGKTFAAAAALRIIKAGWAAGDARPQICSPVTVRTCPGHWHSNSAMQAELAPQLALAPGGRLRASRPAAAADSPPAHQWDSDFLYHHG